MPTSRSARPGIQTLSIHGGEEPDPQSGASAPNLVMSSTFVVDEDISFSANNLTADTPFVYTRWDNPTNKRRKSRPCSYWKVFLI